MASDLSDRYQSSYLWLVRGEYFFLFLASVFALDFTDAPAYFVGFALVLLAGLSLLLVRSISKPEQSWYRARAAAESIKTSAWRYAMAAHPYDGSDAKRKFLSLIVDLLNANKVLSEGGTSPHIGEEQVTSSMTHARSLSMEERAAFYLRHRVKDQKSWYIKKAKGNRRASKLWILVSVAAYSFATALALSHIAFPEWRFVPIEPLIVLASSILGWVQVGKYSELAASFTLTATEIGIAAEEAHRFECEKQFSDFINDTELAFSREHTQWLARQQTAG